MTWPVANLDPVRRLRVLASAYPSAGYGEVTLELPFEETWSWLTDFDRNVQRFDSTVARTRTTPRPDGDLSLLAWTRRNPIPLPFRVHVEPGFCMMRGRARLFLVLMAAVPLDEGRTRYAHAEAVPLRATGFLRRRVQRMVDADLQRLARNIGS
jgi:hypothetical protein